MWNAYSFGPVTTLGHVYSYVRKGLRSEMTFHGMCSTLAHDISGHLTESSNALFQNIWSQWRCGGS
jgi:hypothetical protein